MVVEKVAVGLSGDVLGRYRGVAEPDACTRLDACGVAGTFILRARPRVLIAVLAALGPARRPYGDFLAALAGDRHGGYTGRTPAHLTPTLRRETITQMVIDASGFL